MKIKPLLKTEGSIVVSVSTVALVFGIYNMKVGPVADLHQTNAHDGNMQAAVKKAGWEALVVVAAITILSRDPNVAILGGAAIVGEELLNRHALMSNPGTGQIQMLPPSSYQPAGGATVTDMGDYQAQAG